ncbi:MAG: hypothetical protein Q9167_005906 [Letrouitia subvulpina]
MTSHGIPRVGGPKDISGPARDKERRKIQEYKSLVDQLYEQIQNQQYTQKSLELTTKLLEKNPEYYSIWNIRRRILLYLFARDRDTISEGQDATSDKSRVDFISGLMSSDLALFIPLLRKFPKCYWIWGYRLWLLNKSKELLPPAEAYTFWQRELGLVGKMLTLDSRNFHGWGYRRKIVVALESFSPGDVPCNGSMVEEEFAYTTRMIESNLSNFSAWHRRSKLIPQLLDKRQATGNERRNFLDQELDLIQRALWADPDSKDQSLWFYHQYLVSSFDPRKSPYAITLDLAPNERETYLKRQVDDLQEMLDGAENSKWIYQRLLELSLIYHVSSGRWLVAEDQIQSWVSNLNTLDPMRRGRWTDIAIEFRG